MSDYDSVFSAANALPVDQRFRLIDELWTADPTPLSAAWAAEVERRSAQLDAGQVETVAWETVREESLRRANRHDGG